MSSVEFSRSDILILSNILRLVRQETGLPLKMQSENLLSRLNTAINTCKNAKTHQLYQEFLDTFSQPEILIQLGLKQPHSSDDVKQTIYRGQVQEVKTSHATENEANTEATKGKRKIVYRGQVKWVDK